MVNCPESVVESILNSIKTSGNQHINTYTKTNTQVQRRDDPPRIKCRYGVKKIYRNHTLGLDFRCPLGAMLDHLSRRSRSLLGLCLTSLALSLSVLAFCTSYWCEGTHKVIKPPCLSAVKMEICDQNNSQPVTTAPSGKDPAPRSVTSENYNTYSVEWRGVHTFLQRGPDLLM